MVFLKQLKFIQLFRKLLAVFELEVSSPSSQKPVTGPFY
jgi:hypothetical protein